MRELALVLAACAVVAGCSGEERGAATKGTAGEERAGSKVAEETEPTARDDLGHQAYMRPTRLVVPTAEVSPLDRVARMAAGLSEAPLGTTVFVDSRPGEGGLLAWRDVAGEEPDGHQLAYVTEGLLASDNSDSGLGTGDFEMVAQIDRGSAVLGVRKDPEAESFQASMKDLGDFVSAAKEGPGLVEVADPGANTVYRAGTLALEGEAGMDLVPKSPGEAVIVPAEEVLTDVWAGELRAIAVLGEERSEDLPNVPTSKELGYDVSVPVWGDIAAPAGTPPRVIDELGRAFVASSSSQRFGRALVGTGREPRPRRPEAFALYVEEQARLLSKGGR